MWEVAQRPPRTAEGRMAPKTVELARSLLASLSAEAPQRVMEPTVEEITGEGLHTLFPCCARLQIPAALRDAVTLRIGGPQGDYSIYQLQQLTQGERCDTVNGLVLSEAQQPQRPRPPTLYEKTLVRSLFMLADQVASTLAAHHRRRGEDQREDEPAKERAVETEEALASWAGLGAPAVEEEAAAMEGSPKRPRTTRTQKRKERAAQRPQRKERAIAEPVEPGAGGTIVPGAGEVAQPAAGAAWPAASEAPWQTATAAAASPAWTAAAAGQATFAQEQVQPHPRRRGRLFTTTAEGVQVCFAYAKGGEGSCPTPCPRGRSHVCQICLAVHKNNHHRRWQDWSRKWEGRV